jgi:hypothetical protein
MIIARITLLIIVILTVFLLTTGPAFSGPLKLNPDRTVSLIGPIAPPSLVVITEILDLAKDSKKPIDVVIDSPGGYVSVGFRIIATIEHVKAEGIRVRCFVPGYAASMAFQILLHCSERHALNVSQLLFHRVRIFIGGGGPFGGGGTVMTGPDAMKLGRDLLQVDKAVFKDLEDHLDIERDWILYHFNAETFHIAVNLCDKDPEFLTCHDSVEGLLPFLFSELTKKGEAVFTEPETNTIIYMTLKE